MANVVAPKRTNRNRTWRTIVTDSESDGNEQEEAEVEAQAEVVVEERANDVQLRQVTIRRLRGEDDDVVYIKRRSRPSHVNTLEPMAPRKLVSD